MVCLHSANLRVGTFLPSTEPILTQDRATLHIGEMQYVIVQELLIVLFNSKVTYLPMCIKHQIANF